MSSKGNPSLSWQVVSLKNNTLFKAGLRVRIKVLITYVVSTFFFESVHYPYLDIDEKVVSQYDRYTYF